MKWFFYVIGVLGLISGAAAFGAAQQTGSSVYHEMVSIQLGTLGVIALGVGCLLAQGEVKPKG